MRLLLHLVSAVIASTGLCSCGADTDIQLPADGTASQTRVENEPMGNDKKSGKTEFSEPAATAVADLADRLGIDPAGIEVIENRDVTWGDSSLGCPKPGMAYTQSLVSGSLIRLRAAGRVYHYHSGSGREPFYCAHPHPPADDTGAFSDI